MNMDMVHTCLWYVVEHIALLCCLFRAHWYLVVICFPGLEEPTFEAWTGSDSTGNSHSGTGKLQDQEEAQGSKSLNDKTETTSNRNDNLDTKTGTTNGVW